jgi:hypothetical protein
MYLEYDIYIPSITVQAEAGTMSICFQIAPYTNILDTFNIVKCQIAKDQQELYSNATN